VEISKANKKACIVSNDAVFLRQLVELLIANPLYRHITVYSNEQSSIKNDKLMWSTVKLSDSLASEGFETGDDLFVRIENTAEIEDYNSFIFNLIKQFLLKGYSRSFINVDLFQYLKKINLKRILEYQELEKQILKLPFYSTHLVITVKTSSVEKDLIKIPDLLKTGRDFIGRKLLSSLGLPLIIVPSKKIAMAMNKMTKSLDAVSQIYHSDDIQNIIKHAQD